MGSTPANFSVFLLNSLPPWKEPGQVFEEGLDQIELADELGFHAAWVAEHNARPWGMVASAHLLLAACARTTTQIRLGTGCTRLPVHQPLRLAEDLALLDHISGGRLYWGIGKGYDPKEFQSYGYDIATRDGVFDETLEIVLEAWRTGQVSHAGVHYQIPHPDLEERSVSLYPPIRQTPHPPVFVMVSGSDRTIEAAAIAGHAFILGPVMETEGIVKKVALYRETARAHGRDDDEIDQLLEMSAQLKPTHVGDTVESAAKEFERGLTWFMENRENRGMFGFDKMNQPYEYYVHHRGVLLGPADKIVEDVTDFRAKTGLGGLVGWFDCGGQPAPEVEASLRAFAGALIP